jgi:hypothetical protein
MLRIMQKLFSCLCTLYLDTDTITSMLQNGQLLETRETFKLAMKQTYFNPAELPKFKTRSNSQSGSYWRTKQHESHSPLPAHHCGIHHILWHTNFAFDIKSTLLSACIPHVKTSNLPRARPKTVRNSVKRPRSRPSCSQCFCRLVSASSAGVRSLEFVGVLERRVDFLDLDSFFGWDVRTAF